MSIPSRVMGSGMSAQAAVNICGGLNTGLTAAGANQATGLQLSEALNNMTTVTASTGVVLPPAEKSAIIYIKNSGAQTLTVYPSGSATVNGATSVTIAANAAQWFVGLSDSAWVCNA